MNGKREFGDYQTPRLLAAKVCNFLKEHIGLHPSVVIEPTCGKGSFLFESQIFAAQNYYGIEINEEYCQYCKRHFQDERIQIINDDFFSFSIADFIKDHDEVLVLGNPPWVTNSSLSNSPISNLPVKSNFKKHKGFDAITGNSNFDICEYMILQIIEDCKRTNTTIAMLCKTSVARNVYREIIKKAIPFKYCKNLEFNAKDFFGVNASACLLVLGLSNLSFSASACEVATLDAPDKILRAYSCDHDRFYTDEQANICDLDGYCCFEWRQGIKHDCSKVVELAIENGKFINGFKESVLIEPHYLYPLIKSSMIKSFIIEKSAKYLILPQKYINESIEYIGKQFPLTWNYLIRYEKNFSKRKSIIYSKGPRFAMFGIGEYSFAPYKVAVSGFYKTPVFSLLHNKEKPMMLDDTCYFLSFKSFSTAYVVMLLLNNNITQSFLKAIAFLDSKRPYTKSILQRIDFSKLVAVISYSELKKTEEKLRGEAILTLEMYNSFVEDIKTQDQLLF